MSDETAARLDPWSPSALDAALRKAHASLVYASQSGDMEVALRFEDGTTGELTVGRVVTDWVALVAEVRTLRAALARTRSIAEEVTGIIELVTPPSPDEP